MMKIEANKEKTGEYCMYLSKEQLKLIKGMIVGALEKGSMTAQERNLAFEMYTVIDLTLNRESTDGETACK